MTGSRNAYSEYDNYDSPGFGLGLGAGATEVESTDTAVVEAARFARTKMNFVFTSFQKVR